jgi:hypothetical protein
VILDVILDEGDMISDVDLEKGVKKKFKSILNNSKTSK